MLKHVFKKLYRELKIFVNTVTVTKLWQCYISLLFLLSLSSSSSSSLLLLSLLLLLLLQANDIT